MFDDVRPLKGNENQFIDYINRLEKTYNGKNKDWKYDKRQGIGYPQTNELAKLRG